MKKLLAGILTAICIVVLIFPNEILAKERNEKVIASYLPLYQSWKAEDLDGENLTDAIIAFANFDNALNLSIPSYYQRQMEEVKRIKEVHQDMRVILGIGGGGNSQGFSEVAASKELRERFVKESIQFIKEFNLDGIDIDWEYPVGPDWLPEDERNWADKENFTKLLEDLRAGLDDLEKETGREYLITYATNVSRWAVTTLEYEKVFNLVDRIHLMGYDFEGSWSPKTGHASPLESYKEAPYGLTAKGAIEMFLEYGAPKEKLVLGVPGYSHDFYGVKNENNGLGQAYEKADVSQFSNDALEENFINKNGFKRFFDEDAKVPYLFNGDTFITYEDEESIRYKAEAVLDMELGGMMTWEYFQDRDADLIKVMNKVLNGSKIDEWAANKEYKTDDKVSYEGKIYKCINAHKSNISWNPKDANTLWAVLEDGVLENSWEIGKSYNTGDKVNYKGVEYTCIQGHTSLDGWMPDITKSLWK